MTTVDRGSVRVVFAAGASANVGAEIERLGAGRVLIVSSARGRPGAERFATLLGDRSAGLFAEARQHVPVDLVDDAAAEASRVNADCVLTLGGGSAVGLGKAIALQRDVVVACIPTTYAGSEMTPIYGITGPDGKKTGRDERVRPRLVIYDPALTVNLPLSVSIPSLFNAMAHSVEALYAQDVTAEIAQGAEDSIRAIAAALPVIAASPTDLSGRTAALRGAHLAGLALEAGIALHHKLCHVLGGSFGLPHAETHTVILPHALHYNRTGAPGAVARVAAALAASDGATGIYDLERRVGAPTDLRALGFLEKDIPKATALAMQNAYYNPRPIEQDGVRALLEAAFYGRRPVT